jgi:hypothetical protein
LLRVFAHTDRRVAGELVAVKWITVDFLCS